MDNVLGNQVIYQITIGAPKVGMQFRVGQRVSAGENGYKQITKIVRSENNFHMFNEVAYIIYVDFDGVDRVWRYIEKQPVDVVCDLSQHS